MKCKFCGKKISFSDWLLLKRSCVDHWMENYEIPKMGKFMSNPKNVAKFEHWRSEQNKQGEIEK